MEVWINVWSWSNTSWSSIIDLRKETNNEAQTTREGAFVWAHCPWTAHPTWRNATGKITGGKYWMFVYIALAYCNPNNTKVPYRCISQLYRYYFIPGLSFQSWASRCQNRTVDFRNMLYRRRFPPPFWAATNSKNECHDQAVSFTLTTISFFNCADRCVVKHAIIVSTSCGRFNISDHVTLFPFIHLVLNHARLLLYKMKIYILVII